MARIVRRTSRPEDAAAIQRLADRIRAAADRTLEDPARRQLIAQGYERVRAALEETTPPVRG
jgi:hypothetical protein